MGNAIMFDKCDQNCIFFFCYPSFSPTWLMIESGEAKKSICAVTIYGGKSMGTYLTEHKPRRIQTINKVLGSLSS